MQDINLFKFLWQFISKKKLLFIILVICAIVIDSTEFVATNVFNKKIYTNLEANNFNFVLLSFFIIMYTFCQHNHHFMSKIQDKLWFNCIQKIQMKIRNYLFNYTIQHSMEYFNNSFSGDLNNKINNFVTSFGEIVYIIVKMSVSFSMMFLTCILYADISIYLSILFIILAIFYIFILKSVGLKLKKLMSSSSEAKSVYISQINDDLTNIINIKTFANEKNEKDNIAIAINNIDKVEYDVMRTRGKMNMIHFLIIFCLFFFIMSFGGVMLALHKIDFGTFLFITIIVSIMRFFLDDLIHNLVAYSQIRGKMENALNKILQPIDIKNTNNKKISILEGKIVFKNITFNYKK